MKANIPKLETETYYRIYNQGVIGNLRLTQLPAL